MKFIKLFQSQIICVTKLCFGSYKKVANATTARSRMLQLNGIKLTIFLYTFSSSLVHVILLGSVFYNSLETSTWSFRYKIISHYSFYPFTVIPAGNFYGPRSHRESLNTKMQRRKRSCISLVVLARFSSSNLTLVDRYIYSRVGI